MSSVLEIEKALGQLPHEERWEVARWLLEELHESALVNGDTKNANADSHLAQSLPDYSARRRRIFGSKILPNMVLAGRAEERW